MKILVLGSGGREHAMIKALSLSTDVSEIHAAPGNPGMREAVLHSQINPLEVESIINLCRQHNIDLVVVGPEIYLEKGIVDEITRAGILAFGPSQLGARLESSKIFAKEFMVRNKIPTAQSFVVKSKAQALEAAKNFQPPYVLKADGLAAGKGVFICSSENELADKAKEIFEQGLLGNAGSQALLEQNLEGYEISFLVLTNGKDFEVLPMSQDHKRLKEGNLGPNTGGMGAICPVSLPEHEYLHLIEAVVRPTIAALHKERITFHGVLYFGIMMTGHGPKVLEFNTRFGDPEAQVILPLLDGDWAKVFYQVAKGNLIKLNWRKLFSCCVVLAAPGYPDNVIKDVPIRGNPHADTPSSYFVHAGTAFSNSNWLTNGGRVLNSVGLGSSINEAVYHAYKQAETVKWEGLQFRKDIGKQFLN